MMMDKRYGDAVLDDLAALVARARQLSGGPWQVAGIKAALRKAAQRPGTIDLAKLSQVALRVAADPNARTPERMAQDGPWWSDTVSSTDALPKVDLNTACHECLEEPAHPIHDRDHKYQDPRHLPSTDHAARAAEIRATWATGGPCASCGNDREHLVHGGTGRENDHEFQPATDPRRHVNEPAHNQEESHG